MSAGLSPAEWISTISAGITANWVTVGPIALLVYEYAITFGQEVRYVWMQKKTGAAVLFLMIRYASLVTWCGIEAATYMLTLSDQSCSKLNKAEGIMEIFILLPIAVFSALRTLALSNMNRTLAIVTFILACGPVAINLWVYIAIGVFGTNIPVIGCIAESNETAHEALMWTKLGLAWMQVVSHEGDGTTRDGVLHDLITGQAISLIPIFTEPLTVIIICRFLLALQRANIKSTGLETTDSELGGSGGDLYGSGTLHFASAMIGSVGGAIDAGLDDDDDSELTIGYVDEYEDPHSPDSAKQEGDADLAIV
ncbi:hypothetical protein C8Q73DRAFT_666290 [Cubamyces lactineus]|nr:hypothetical protein C8Q73DRAFT_666290 [Cubamyces lactineus]